jgi:hypothetical protein
MFGRKKAAPEAPATPEAPKPLRAAVREARIEAAEKSGVVVDLRDAEVARLELLNEALDPVFAEVPANVDLFDRGVSRGDTPRLWVDVVAHVEMGRDKRQYRFVQDSRFGRAVLAESYEVADIAPAITRYVARRLVERERAIAGDFPPGALNAEVVTQAERRTRFFRGLRNFIFGIIVGVAALFALAMYYTAHH